MTGTLIVSHIRDRLGEPLCIVRNLPGLDAERRPEQLEALARQLVCAARDAQSGATGERQYPNLNDAAPRHPATPSFLEYPDAPTYDDACNFEPVGIDSEGGSHD